jgi:hypothetical protein
MRRFINYSSFLLVFFLIPVTIVSAQDTKTEKKIKIIIDDGSGRKVIIDTIMTDQSENDPLILKDGKVIVFSSPGEITHMKKGKGKQEVIVNLETEGDNTGDISKTITVISADSLKAHANGNEKVMIVKSDRKEGQGNPDNHYVITRSGQSGKGSKGNVYFYSNDDKDTEKGNSEKFDVFFDNDDRDEMADTKVRYVVAKNGMVVTVEGNDEEKAKELFNEIEKKLDEGTSSKAGRETSKTTTPKPVKK